MQPDTVSIPQSGLQAFRPPYYALLAFNPVSFNPSIGLTSVPTHSLVTEQIATQVFQSLNRAYKRSDVVHEIPPQTQMYSFNPSIGLTSVPTHSISPNNSGLPVVSIPQSGLQAFRHLDVQRGKEAYSGFNPSIGLTSVPTSVKHETS